jgi:hypothetical protein
MADTTAATATTSADLDFNLKDYINNEDTGLLAAIKRYFDLYDAFHAKKAEKGGLQDGKLMIPDHPPIGASELRTMKAHIVKTVQNLPKVIASSERAKKAQKSAARRANMTGDRQQPPSIFTGELVAFFKAADLGTKPDGTGRLQDMPEMAAFFTNGVANLTFGVSLLNVWGYRNKLNGDHHRVVLDANAKKYLKTAIEKLRLKKTANIAKARESGDAKAIENSERELTRFNDGEIQNKDYMTLFIEYRNAEQPAKETLLKFSEVVSSMSDVTKARNEHYKTELQAKHPKVVAAPVKKTAATPVRKSASPAPVKKTEAVAPLPTPAPLPAVPARASSPAAATTKKSKK